MSFSSLLVGLLGLTLAVPVAAQSPYVENPVYPEFRTPVPGEPGADPSQDPEARAEYKQHVKERIAAWDERMEQFADRVNERSATAGGLDNQRVTYAWRAVNTEWQQFQSASPDEWAEAQRELELALQRLQEAWEQREPSPGRELGEDASGEEAPNFYAVDLATRMQA